MGDRLISDFGGPMTSAGILTPGYRTDPSITWLLHCTAISSYPVEFTKWLWKGSMAFN